MTEVTEPAMTSSNDYYADLRLPSKQGSELIRRICCLFLKSSYFHLIISWPILWNTWLLLEASKQESRSSGSQVNPPWTASLSLLSLERHTHTHTSLITQLLFMVWYGLPVSSILNKEFELLVFDTLHPKSCWSIYVISNDLNFCCQTKIKKKKKKEWMAPMLFLTLAKLHFEVKTVDRPFFTGCLAYTILLLVISVYIRRWSKKYFCSDL